MAATLVGGSGVMLGWKWYLDRHLREIRRIQESTALALEANMDYRDSVVHSYKEMCKILQGYGYLRQHFETVREFVNCKIGFYVFVINVCLGGKLVRRVNQFFFPPMRCYF